jgi:leucyl aminopeptidase
VGLGKRDDFTPERARLAAAVALARAQEAGGRAIAWVTPEGMDQHQAARALVEGTLLADYRFERKSKRDEDGRVERLEVLAGEDLAAVVDQAALVTDAQNSARELQNLPSNELTPSKLADHAVELASGTDGVDAEVLGPEEIQARNMGGIEAVARGSHQEPRLILLRYDGGGPFLSLVGKAVTFDSGGISLKPSDRMQEMKMDMSGGASVIEATGAIARLRLPIRLLTVVPSTENMPSGHATKPGDIITISNRKTVEVNNTDAEGRLILADALSYTASAGAQRIVDVATLTGAIVIALGSSYAGLFSNDDELATAVQRAGDATGELAWRLPLHPDYKDLTRGKIADLVNVSDQRKASSAYAASFLEEFVDGRPWVHLDIAGTAWGQDNRDYVGKGASGWGVRLLVELARSGVELERSGS